MAQEIPNKIESKTTANKKKYSREQLVQFLSEIERRMVISNTPYIHSMLALNDILRLPEAAGLFDDDLKQRARDLWIKVKSAGLRLNNPPFLFGSQVGSGVGSGDGNTQDNGKGSSEAENEEAEAATSQIVTVQVVKSW